MTLEEARSICEDIIARYNVNYCDYQEIRAEGEVKFVHITVKLKVDRKVLDFSANSAKIGEK